MWEVPLWKKKDCLWKKKNYLKQKNDLRGGLSERIKISSNAKKKKKKEKKWKGNIKKRFYGEIWKENCRNALSLSAYSRLISVERKN